MDSREPLTAAGRRLMMKPGEGPYRTLTLQFGFAQLREMILAIEAEAAEQALRESQADKDTAYEWGREDATRAASEQVAALDWLIANVRLPQTPEWMARAHRALYPTAHNCGRSDCWQYDSAPSPVREPVGLDLPEPDGFWESPEHFVQTKPPAPSPAREPLDPHLLAQAIHATPWHQHGSYEDDDDTAHDIADAYARLSDNP